MKNLLRLAGLLLAGSAGAQQLPAASTPTPVNWRPTANPATLSLDLDGDGQPDLRFSYESTTSVPAGPTQTYFLASTVPGTSLELAIDAAEFDSAHRYQDSDLLEGPVLWQRTSTYLDYKLSGNGGLGGRGFFRNNADGYVVLRKRLAGTTQYWWVHIGPRSQPTDNWVLAYGSSVVPLAAALPAAPPAARAFPNPTTDGWHLPQPMAYQLFDCQGCLVSGSAQPAARVGAAVLAPGIYTLLLLQPSGVVTRQLVRKD